MPKLLVDVFLDSGAYSAFTQGAVINLDDYIAYIKKNRQYLGAYACLDVLPGKDGVREFGQNASEYSAARSHENQVRMKAAGLAPVPVFHRGENFKWLEKMIDQGEPYIGLSPYLKSNRSEVVDWLDDCFTILTDTKGRPLVKTHGFAVTSPDICRRYPWFSVDSTTWAIYAGFGLMYAPIYVNGTPDFTRNPVKYHLTHRANQNAIGFDHLGEYQKKTIMQFYEAHGLNLTKVRNNPNHRRFLQIKYFQGLAATCRDIRFKNQRDGLIEIPIARMQGKPFNFAMKMYFATLISHQVQVTLLQKAQANNRLISYHELAAGLRYKTQKQANKYDNLKNFATVGLARPDLKYTPKPRWKLEGYLIKRRMDLIDHIEEITNEANRPFDETEIG